MSGSVAVVFLGQNLDGLADQVSPYGASKVVLCGGGALDKYNTIAYTKALAEIVKLVGAQIILGTASAQGKDILPRLAANLEAGMASEATELKIDGGKLVAKKPIYSGKAFADVVFQTAIQVASTRPNSFPLAKPDASIKAEVVNASPDVGTPRCILKEVTQSAVGKVDLTEAEIIKYMSNLMLASKVLLANEFFMLAEHVGANYKEIYPAVSADPRIGTHLSVPGPDGDLGFGGACFPKDTLGLLSFAVQKKIDMSALSAIWKKNLKIRKVRDWEHMDNAFGRGASKNKI